MTFNHFWEGTQPWTRNNAKLEIHVRVGHFWVPGILHWDDPPSRRQIMNYLEFVCHLFLGFNLPKQGQPSNQKTGQLGSLRYFVEASRPGPCWVPKCCSPFLRGHHKSPFVRVKKMAPFFGVGAGSLIDSKSFVHRPGFVVWFCFLVSRVSDEKITEIAFKGRTM